MTVIIDQTKSMLESEYASLTHNANALKETINSLKTLIRMNTIKESQKIYLDSLNQAETDYLKLCLELSYLRDKIKAV